MAATALEPFRILLMILPMTCPGLIADVAVAGGEGPTVDGPTPTGLTIEEVG